MKRRFKRTQNGLVICFAILLLFPFLDGTASAQDAVKGKPVPHGIYSPIRIAFGADGNLLVSDYRTHMIVVVDKKTNQVRRWFEVKGRPLGVAYLRGHIYVGNETRRRIEVYNPAGVMFKKNGVFDTVIKRPQDIAVDEKSGKIFVVDGFTKTVKVFNTKGKVLSTIPSAGPDPSLLANPTGITVDSIRKEVIVSDYGDENEDVSPRIQIFNFNGEHQDTIKDVGQVSSTASAAMLSKPKMGMGGGWGDKPRFSRPQGLAVDDNGHIFMIDCYSAEVMVFNRDDGLQIKTLGGYGSEPGQMRLPLDLVRDNDTGDLFVTNNRLARIEIFRQGGLIQ